MGMVRRSGGQGRWEGVEPRTYAHGAEKHVLVGAADGAADVELRYFRIPAGCASLRESHPHEHAVLVLHGTGRVVIAGEEWPLGPGDAVFVGSGEEHRFTAGAAEDLGFMCTALARRRPPA